MRERLDALLADDGEGTAFARLAADPGRVGLESLLAEIAKLELLRGLGAAAGPAARPAPGPGQALPPARGRRERLGAAPASRAHPPAACWPSGARRARREVVDGLVELLIQVTHRITVKAERRVVEELVEEAREVRGKAGILFRVAEAAVGQPGRRRARGDLPCRRRAHLRGAGPRGPGARHAAEPARPHRGARLLRLLLPPDDAASCWRRWTSAPTTARIARCSTRSTRSGARRARGGSISGPTRSPSRA